MGLEQRTFVIRNRVLHCLKRLKERCGFFVDESEYFDMVLSIVNQESEFLFRVSNTVTVHRVWFKGERLTVVYNKKHHVVVTVLRNSWIKQDKDGNYYMRRKKEKRKKPVKKRVHWKVKLKHKERELR